MSDISDLLTPLLEWDHVHFACDPTSSDVTDRLEGSGAMQSTPIRFDTNSYVTVCIIREVQQATRPSQSPLTRILQFYTKCSN